MVLARPLMFGELSKVRFFIVCSSSEFPTMVLVELLKCGSLALALIDSQTGFTSLAELQALFFMRSLIDALGFIISSDNNFDLISALSSYSLFITLSCLRIIASN